MNKRYLLLIIVAIYLGSFLNCFSQEDTTQISISKISTNLIDVSYNLQKIYLDSSQYSPVIKDIRDCSSYLSSVIIKEKFIKGNFDYYSSLDTSISLLNSVLTSGDNIPQEKKMQILFDVQSDLQLKYKDAKSFGSLTASPIRKIKFRVVLKKNDGTLASDYKIRANFWVCRNNANPRYTFNEQRGPIIEASLCVNEYDIWLEDNFEPPRRIPERRYNAYKVDNSLDGKELIIIVN